MRKKITFIFILIFLTGTFCLKTKKSAFDFSTGGVGLFSFFYGYLYGFQINAVTVPPSITSASILPDVTVTFSSNLLASSATNNSVKLFDKNGTQITTTMSVSGNTLKVSANSMLSFSSIYTLSLTTQLSDSSGRTLSSNYSTSFTTDTGTDHFLRSSSLNIDGTTPLGYIISSRVYPTTDKLYFAWAEKADATLGNIAFLHVKSIDKNKSVSLIGTNLNYDGSKSADGPSMSSIDNTLYLAWRENVEIRVKSFNGSSWTSSDSGSLTSVPTPIATDRPYLHTFNGKLYCIFGEEISTGARLVRIKELNGTTWSFIDGGLLNSKNPTSTDGAGYKPVLITYNNILYAAWMEKNQSTGGLDVRIKKYNGSNSWSFIDNGGIQYNNGMSTNADISPYLVTLVSNNNKLYSFWIEDISGSSRQIRGKVFNGNDTSPSWTSIDNGSSLSYGGANSLTYALTSISHNNRVFILWQEFTSGVVQLRLATFSGEDSAPRWFFVDSNPTTDKGLTFNTTKSAAQGSMGSFNGNLYIGWSEQFSGNEYNA